jgi:asparagine synthase (glutamine-hydrolysing)
MIEFAGLVRFDGQPIDPASASRLSRAIFGRQAPHSWRPDPHVLMVEARAHGAGAAAPAQLSPETTLVLDAWLEAPGDLARALNVSPRLDHRRLAAEACRAWGVETAVERVHGSISAAAWDRARQRLVLGRDAFGNLPLYYVATPEFVLFASSLHAMLAMPETPRDLDVMTVADTLTIALQDQEQTIYRHIRRVPPGGIAAFQQGSVRTSRYYAAATIPDIRLRTDRDYVDAARALLDQAVAARLPATGRIASELSGGLDSGGVAATAARLLGDRRLTAYTRVASAPHPEHPVDERALAGQLVARYSNIDWVVVDEERHALRDTDPRSEAAATLVPRTSSFNATWFETLALRVERDGAEMLLTGGTGNMTLSYHGRRTIAEDLYRGRWLKAARDMVAPGADARVRGWRALARELAPRAVKRWWAGGAPWTDFSLVSRDFLNEIGYGAHARARGHDVPFDLPMTSREHRLSMIQAQRARDFAGYVTRQSRSYITRDPYIDRRLAEFCLGIPEDQYWRNGQDRWLARRVLADRVPAETLSQRRIGRQSPDWYTLATSRHARMVELVDRIERSPVASQVLDMPRIRALLADWPKDADAAEKTVMLHGHALQRAIALGGFLCWHEGRND